MAKATGIPLYCKVYYSYFPLTQQGCRAIAVSLIKHPKAKVTKNLIEESLTSMAQCGIMGH